MSHEVIHHSGDHQRNVCTMSVSTYIYIYIACMHYVHKPVKPSPNNNCPPFSIYSALPFSLAEHDSL